MSASRDDAIQSTEAIARPRPATTRDEAVLAGELVTVIRGWISEIVTTPPEGQH